MVTYMCRGSVVSEFPLTCWRFGLRQWQRVVSSCICRVHALAELVRAVAACVAMSVAFAIVLYTVERVFDIDFAVDLNSDVVAVDVLSKSSRRVLQAGYRFLLCGVVDILRVGFLTLHFSGLMPSWCEARGWFVEVTVRCRVCGVPV